MTCFCIIYDQSHFIHPIPELKRDIEQRILSIQQCYQLTTNPCCIRRENTSAGKGGCVPCSMSWNDIETILNYTELIQYVLEIYGV